MDLLHLVDRLEELIASAQKMPIGSRAIIDRRRLLDIVDQMRVVIPQEVREAREAVAHREELNREADEEARMIVARAEEQAARLVEQHEITAAARERAEVLAKQAEVRLEEHIAQANADIQARIAESRRLAEQQMAEADAYAAELLRRLERQLQTFAKSVHTGLDQLEAGRAERPAAADETTAGTGAGAGEPVPSVPAAATEAPDREDAPEPIPLHAGRSERTAIEQTAGELENLLRRPPARPTGAATAADSGPAGKNVIDDLSQPRLDDEPGREGGPGA